MEIETADEGLTVDGWNAEFTGYPFRENGYFRSDDPELAKIWETGWRARPAVRGRNLLRLSVLRADAIHGRHAYPVPHFAVCQRRRPPDAPRDQRHRLVGDPGRHPAQPLSDESRSDHPSFSLYWINCLHDYWMHRDDPDFVRSYLPVLKSVLGWYERKIDPNTGMLGQMPYWNFLDWPKQWPWTTYEPPTGAYLPAAEAGARPS